MIDIQYLPTVKDKINKMKSQLKWHMIMLPLLIFVMIIMHTINIYNINISINEFSALRFISIIGCVAISISFLYKSIYYYYFKNKYVI